MGFDVTNDIFATNSWYFRNSLVRNYNNLSRGVRETTEFLELFLRNLLLKENKELKNRYAHIRWETIKQDIVNEKQDIGSIKQDIRATKQDIQAQKQGIQEKEQYIEVPDVVSKKQDSIFKLCLKDLGMSTFLDVPK